MKQLFYATAGIIFSLGLLISGMADPEKIKAFLEVGTPQPFFLF